MAWVYLVIAGLLETVWAVGLKYTEGFTKLWPSVGTLVAMAASIFLLSMALRTLPIGTGYAIWTGIGTVGVAIMGVMLFGESLSLLRMLFLLMIVIGILGLKLVSAD